MLNVDLVVLPNAAPSILLGMFDVLCSVGRDWAILTGEGSPSSGVRARLVAEGPEELSMGNGIHIRPHLALAQAVDADVVLVPDILLSPADSIRHRFPVLSRWLRQRYDAGAVIASVCSGSLILAEAGLLDNLPATTHWAVQAHFRRDYPKVVLEAERVFIAVGEGERLVTAGGAASWHDLVLYLIARFIGPQEAIRIAKLYLLQHHADGQLPYACITIRGQHTDKVIGEAQHWIALHYDCPAPVTAMARLCQLSERTFKRRFKAATGMGPMDYVHHLRVEEAKQMLESDGLPVEQIAAEVGYDDATFFRRLFKRKTALTPAQYRRKFQPIARLRQVAAPEAGTDKPGGNMPPGPG